MIEKKIIAYILRGKNRINILNILNEGEAISSQIEKKTGMYKTHVGRTLKELKHYSLIKCKNPKDRDFKFYALTKKGKDTIEQVNKLLKEI